jgi:hypothetical protein
MLPWLAIVDVFSLVSHWEREIEGAARLAASKVFLIVLNNCFSMFCSMILQFTFTAVVFLKSSWCWVDGKILKLWLWLRPKKNICSCCLLAGESLPEGKGIFVMLFRKCFLLFDCNVALR